MPSRLQSKVAIVTGAARGNGKGIARAMAKEGAIVALWDILDIVEETAKEIRDSGYQATSFRVDVSDVAQVNQATQEVVKRFGRVDILVNNAGIGYFVPFVEMTDQLRDKIFGVNLIGVWNCTKAVIPGMIQQKYGKIVNIASVTGPRVSSPGLTAYSATKGAVCGLTRALALEVAELGINVNVILPGYVDTPLLRGVPKELGIDEKDFIEMLSRSVPMKRLGTIDEIGDLAVFLASEESKYITGQEIVFDGGNIIQEEKIESTSSK
jgi:NAD(P)-dependent dehydrogenase (short-subunit alcohol dehydrogenase family)